jgi:hypothetical protein
VFVVCSLQDLYYQFWSQIAIRSYFQRCRSFKLDIIIYKRVTSSHARYSWTNISQAVKKPLSVCAAVLFYGRKKGSCILSPDQIRQKKDGVQAACSGSPQRRKDPAASDRGKVQQRPFFCASLRYTVFTSKLIH